MKSDDDDNDADPCDQFCKKCFLLREPCFKEAVEAKSSFFLLFCPISRNSRAHVISVFIILQLLCSLSAPSVDLVCVSTACFMQQFKSFFPVLNKSGRLCSCRVLVRYKH